MQNKLNPFWRFFLILYSFLFLNARSLSHTLSFASTTLGNTNNSTCIRKSHHLPTNYICIFFVFIFIRFFAFNKQLVVGLHRHDYNLPSYNHAIRNHLTFLWAHYYRLPKKVDLVIYSLYAQIWDTRSCFTANQALHLYAARYDCVQGAIIGIQLTT